MHTAQQFATDQNLFTGLIWLIGVLGSLIVLLGTISIRLIIIHFKSSTSARKEMTVSMETMNEKLDTKFQNIDRYVRRHDLKHAINSAKLDHITVEISEAKKKIEKHSDILFQHEKSIAGLKG